MATSCSLVTVAAAPVTPTTCSYVVVRDAREHQSPEDTQPDAVLALKVGKSESMKNYERGDTPK